MRIIAGQFRGRLLLPPPDQSTRPVTDRVKQSLFDILTPLIPGAIVYDCFAGTGSMGLECLSRGAAHAVFFESYRPALAALRKNIQTLAVTSNTTLIDIDLFKHFQKAAAPANRAELIFLDPPYRFVRERAADLQALATAMKSHHLAPTGTLIFRHDAADALSFPDFTLTDSRHYGSMALEFLRSIPVAEN